MARRAKRSILTVHRQIAKDNARTIQANSPGGRYYKATVSDRLRAAHQSVAEADVFRIKKK